MASAAIKIPSQAGSSVERSTGWNATPRDGAPELLALCGRTPTPGELYAYLERQAEAGVCQSAARSVALQIVALVDFDQQHVERTLQELERRGLVICEGGSVYLPAALRDTCSAPSSTNSIRRVCRLVRLLGPVLRERVTRDLLDVSARADLEREKRRKGAVRESLFEQLKRELGVQLVALPDLPEEPEDRQLSLPLAAPRPEVRIVKSEDLDEQALCMLALIGDQETVKASCGAGHPPDVRPVGPEQPSLVLPTFLPRGETTLSGTPFEPGELHEQKDRVPGARRPVAAQAGHAAEPVRGVQNEDAGGAGAGVHQGGGRRSDVPPRRAGSAGDASTESGAVSAELRAGKARLERFIERSRDASGVARFIVGKIDAASTYVFDEAVKRIEQRHGATQEDLDAMAEILARGEKWGHVRGMQLRMCRKPYLVDSPDHFEELLLDARTPARKAQQRGALPQPAVSVRDDLDDLFDPPARSTG